MFKSIKFLALVAAGLASTAAGDFSYKGCSKAVATFVARHLDDRVPYGSGVAACKDVSGPVAKKVAVAACLKICK